MTKNLANSKGFTLVELSIVIIIIGFLIAGIAAGQSLIKQAALNKIITDAQSYTMIINSFKLKYGYYPGDSLNASAYWPACDPTPANCDGDGDGFVEWPNEPFRAWQSLALSGLISGTYNGTTEAPIVAYGDIVKDGFWRVETYTGQIYTLPGYSKTTLGLLSPVETVINGANAFWIDSRVDDGIPSNGRVQGLDVLGFGCVKQSDGVTTAFFNYNSLETLYNLTDNFPGCGRLLFYLD